MVTIILILIGMAAIGFLVAPVFDSDIEFQSKWHKILGYTLAIPVAIIFLGWIISIFLAGGCVGYHPLC